MSVKRGDVILIPFPFTDLTSTKVRPCVIVSSDPQENDVIVAFVSSVISRSPGKNDLLLTSKDQNFTLTGLKRDSVIKAGKLLTISRSLILRRLGHISAITKNKLNNLLETALGLT